ncbi:MAG: tyrosine--tRNA ligase [bacterium]|nr:tyrosine--tRNA ligase [bacterium]
MTFEEQAELQVQKLERATAEIISRDDLKRKIANSLRDKKPLRIKLGLDPTAPHIHLGFAVVLRKLRQFQDLGHHVVIVIGDFTARVGDPTGRSATRKVLSVEQIKENANTYRNQLSRILDPEKTEVRFNSEWLEQMNFGDVIALASKYTVARILERDDFERRFKNGIPIGVHEFIYPLMQGYDSVMLHADVEMGGTDQKFNNLVGRELQREDGQESQAVVLMPILEGIDGVQKMSKSLGNYVGITETPAEMFLKLMQIPDTLIRRYFELCTDVPMDEVDARLQSDNPRDCKRWLAREIIALYHSQEEAEQADQEWQRVVSNKGVPTDIEECVLESASLKAVDLVMQAGLAPSKREARRLVEQGAVLVDGTAWNDPNQVYEVSDGAKLKVGKKWRALRVK